jgi:Ca-activated chloride channel family protein
MVFLHPERLALLAVLPVVVALWRVSGRLRRERRRQFEDFLKVARISRVASEGRELVRFAAVVATVVVLVLAMARPLVEREVTRPIYRKQDVVVLLDASLSMLAQDIHPSRIGRAKEEIRRFILNRGPAVDRVGLVTFAGSSVITSYLTSDPNNLAFYLDFMDIVPRISYGTDIGAALGNAMSLVRLEAQAAAPEGQDAANQTLFILLADGEHYGESLEGPLDQLAAAGIPVLAIGIGSRGDATIPFMVDGREYMLADDDGALVSARFDDSSLRQIATATRGAYHRSLSGAELSRVAGDFLEAGREVVGRERVVATVDLFPHRSVAALLLLAFVLLI